MQISSRSSSGGTAKERGAEMRMIEEVRSKKCEEKEKRKEKKNYSLKWKCSRDEKQKDETESEAGVCGREKDVW
uniref:Uncharacterized protein n=1 Tax=Setaria digitata TaxID=48799 RepID=A0A915Q7W8_9BILA